MTIKNLALAAAALCALSCTEFENGFDLTEYKYEQAFVDRFGEIDPNQNWGFGEKITSGGMVTRSSTNVNANEWASIYKLDVPGWPFDDENEIESYKGKYAVKDNTHGFVLKTESELSNSDIPAGGVTEEEIQYVSEWFRSNYNPTSEIVHWTDFFIEDISADADRASYPDGERIMSIYPYDKTTGKYSTNTSPLSYGMDQLKVKTIDNTENDGWDHINDFNAGRTNHYPSENEGNNNVRNIKFYYSAGTESFEYRGSDDDTRYQYYTIQHLTFTGASGRHYDGYYLGFDYAYLKEAGSQIYKKERDYYFSNWIVKITPAIPKEPTPGDGDDIPAPPTVNRIFCEDLGSTYDFDFNDVVFDVKYENQDNGKYTAVVTLQAAAGTMPIYVGNYEAHHMLGVDTKTPVNAGPKTTTRPVSIFRIKDLVDTDPRNIPVTVNNNGAINIELMAEQGAIPQKICVPATVGWPKENADIQDAYPFFKAWISNTSEWACAGVTPDNTKSWTARISTYWYNKDFSYTNWLNANNSGTGAVKKITYINKANSSEKHSYYIWHSYRNTNHLYKYEYLPTPTDNSQIKDVDDPDDDEEAPQEDPNAKYNIYVQSESNDFGTAYIINEDETTSDQKSNCDKGSQYKIKAVAKDGYIFEKWDDGDTNAERTITVNNEHTYIAHFAFNTEGYTKIGELDGDNIKLIDNPTIEQGAEYIVVANISAVGSSTSPAVLKINSQSWSLGWDTSYKGMVIIKVYGDTSLNPSFSFAKENNITVSKLAIYKKNN